MDGPTSPTQLLPRVELSTLRAELRASQRLRLMHGIAHTVAEHGYAAATVAHVCQHAGVSRKAFYDYFDDKQACFLAMYDDVVATMARELRAAFAGPGDWRERFRLAVVRWLELCAAEPEFTRVYLIEIWNATPETQARAVSGSRQMTTLLRLTNQAAREADPTIVEATDDELDALAGGWHRLMLLRTLDGRIHELPELLPTLLTISARVIARGWSPSPTTGDPTEHARDWNPRRADHDS